MILLGLLFVLLAILGTPLFVLFGGLAWFLFRAADIDAAALMIDLYRMASAPTLLPIPLLPLRGLSWRPARRHSGSSTASRPSWEGCRGAWP